MERISSDKLNSGGAARYKEHENAAWHFLEAGYFHVEDCEGDHHYYYRYVISGEIWEMLEQDIHNLRSTSPVDREKCLKPYR